MIFEDFAKKNNGNVKKTLLQICISSKLGFMTIFYIYRCFKAFRNLFIYFRVFYLTFFPGVMLTNIMVDIFLLSYGLPA